MGRLRFGLQLAVAIISLWAIGGCGGRKPAGQSPYAAKITLSPGNTTSVQLGSTFAFIASAQNAAGGNLSLTYTYSSNNTAVLNVAPNGVACAGIWDSTFSICTPAGIGVAQVTASAPAVNASSAPTYVFVHPPIDNITVTGVLLNGVPIQEPCLSQGQTMTVQAAAYSQGVDISSSVGPFIWTANNSSVVKLTPIVNSNYNFPTNQATATAVTPGITQIYATASGVTSTSFQQPNLVNSPPVTFDFFETCPIQNIVLEMGYAGSQRTSFAVSKGTAGQTAVATVTDVMGNTSLPNLNNGIVLSKTPLTWSASHPAVVSAAAGCTLSCAISTPSPGSGSITASCSPPTCNVGYPEVPPAFSPSSLAACAQYVHSFLPQVTSCNEFIPAPVYASPLPNQTTAAISGLVTGTPGTTSVLAGSLGCANEPPSTCGVGVFSFTSGKTQVGTANALPDSPNSMLFDLAGDKVYMGSYFGALSINPSNFGTSTSPFTALSTVTGKVLAVAPNGFYAVFSDTSHSPNQVYLVNGLNASAPQVVPLNINSASIAAFSPDNLKAFIFGRDSNNNPVIYVYSTVQALETTCWIASSAPCTPLPVNATVSSIAFSTNGAFAYVAHPSDGAGPAVSVYNTCDNHLSQDKFGANQIIPLAATPVAFRALPDGQHFIALEDNGSFDYITASISGIPVATLTQAATSICPMTVSNTVQNFNLNQGNIQPINFFVSADGTLLYIVASNLNSIVIYNFAAGSVVGGIQLVSTPGGVNPTPLAADISADAGTILVAASDGYLHQISTSNGGVDTVQNQFPFLANYLNPFCTFTPSQGACLLDFVASKP